MIPWTDRIEFRFVFSKNYPRIYFCKYTSFKGFELKIVWFYFQAVFQ